MVFDAVTESGTVYRIDADRGFWARYKPQSDGSYCTDVAREKIWVFRVCENPTALPWHDWSQWESVSAPVEGSHLYISARDFWFVSKRVVRVLPKENWDSPVVAE